MKPTIINAQDSFAISRDVYESSDLEAREVVDLYHNRQYTQAEIDVLNKRGQPVETFNIIKAFSNAIMGYFESVLNTIQIKPRYTSNPTAALLLNDVVQYVLDETRFEDLVSDVILDGLLTGKMSVHYDVVDTGEKDRFGRKLKKLNIEHIPSWQRRLDPMSFKKDGSDARFSHRWKWVDAEEFKARWGEKNLARATSYSTYGVEDAQAEFERRYNMRLSGKFNEWENYLVVTSIIKDGDKTWALTWHDDIILEKKLVPYKKVQSPFRDVIMSNSDQAEHYGPFREVVETQKAINQALIQIQLLINTKKAIVEKDAVDNIEEFAEQFNRVNNIVVVSDLQGIRIEDLSRDVLAQYNIIDAALTRVQKVLGVNDSFLGTTFASESGRKVNLQQNASKSQLSPILKKVKFLYEMVGTDVVNFIQQYYTAEQILRVSDKANGDRYIQVNKPITMPNGKRNPDGSMAEEFVFDEEIDPETGKPMEDERGNILMTPLNDPDTDIKFADVDVKVVAVPYNNAAEQNQLLFETFLNGPTGQSVLQTNPAGYYKIAGLQVSEMGTKNSQDIAQVLLETGQLVSQGRLDPTQAMGGNREKVLGGALGGSNGGGPRSQTLQIPQGGM